MFKKRILNYDFRFLKEDDKFYSMGNKTIKFYTYDLEPDFVFGLSDQNTCNIYICFYNNLKFFEANKSKDLVRWLNLGLSTNAKHQQEFSESFPLFSQFGLQDILLLFEAWILLRKSFKSSLTYLRSEKLNKYVEIRMLYGNEINWPFNNLIFVYYYFTYIFIFYLKNNRKSNKRFVHAWNSILRNKDIHRTKFNKNFIDEYEFPAHFKIKSIPEDSVDYGKLAYRYI
jgi:hypothetical protein